MIGVGIAISQQKLTNLSIVAGNFIVGIAYDALYLRPRSSTHWHAPEAPITVEDPSRGNDDRYAPYMSDSRKRRIVCPDQPERYGASTPQREAEHGG